MASRNELHSLVESLPDAALESASAALVNMQIWPPPVPPEFRKLQDEFRDRPFGARHPAERGTIRGGTAGGSYKLGGGGKMESGYFSSHRSEDGTFVIETHRFYKGYELTIVERLTLRDGGDELIYSSDITGPHNASNREIIFKL
ncbi:MAG: hypothetical protein ACRD4V_01845 [Candidatus Acidiferrales bacterium]